MSDGLLQVAGDEIGVELTAESLNALADSVTVSVPAGAVGARQLAYGTIGEDKLSGAIAGQLAIPNGAVREQHLAAGSVTTDKLAVDAVEASALADDSVDEDRLAISAVGTDALGDGSVGVDAILHAAVGTEALADAAVGAAAIALGAVTEDKLADGACGDAAFADAAITSPKLAGLGFAMPTGSVMPFAAESSIDGWVACEGQSVSRTDPSYADLFAAIGTSWGDGDTPGSTFRIPDFRGLFPRGKDVDASRDPDKASRTAIASGGATGNAVGSIQAAGMESHLHAVNAISYTAGSGGVTPQHTLGAGSEPLHAYTIALFGGNDTRSRNASVKFWIKL